MWFSPQLRTQLPVIALVGCVVVGGGLVAFLTADQNALDSEMRHAGTVVDMAEAYQELVSSQKAHVLSGEASLEEQQAEHPFGALAAYSQVVERMPAKAKFRVVSDRASKHANQPDEFEQRAIRSLRRSGAREYWQTDSEVVRYARALRATPVCMACHSAAGAIGDRAGGFQPLAVGIGRSSLVLEPNELVGVTSAAMPHKTPAELFGAQGGVFWVSVGFLVLLFGGSGYLFVRHQSVKRQGALVEQANSERAGLIREINRAIENERADIAVEIHDVLNAMLVRIRLEAQGIVALAARATPDAVIDEMVARAHTIVRHANELYAQSRRIVRRLRPETLDLLGIEQAVAEMVEGYNEADPLRVISFEPVGDLGVVEGDVAIAAFRVIQEALSNVIKHSQATKVEVRLQHDGSANMLRIKVSDNGKGFDTKSQKVGVGVIGMRERVRALSGDLRLESTVGKGTSINAEIPVPVGEGGSWLSRG